jgi:hypothetical protein
MTGKTARNVSDIGLFHNPRPTNLDFIKARYFQLKHTSRSYQVQYLSKRGFNISVKYRFIILKPSALHATS